MLKKIGIGLGILLVSLYLIFLILPFCLNGVINSHKEEVVNNIEKSTGFKLYVENIKLYTTPKLTVGLGITKLGIKLPNDDPMLVADNVRGKLSLIPLIAKNIEIDMVGADNVNVNLKVKKDGKFLIEDYIKKQDVKDDNNKTSNTMSLPFGLKLSNHLPNMLVNNYNISFIDSVSDNSYSIYGEKFLISDFILNKKVKVVTNGYVMLNELEQFKYDVNILNKIMPSNLDLNELVFSPKNNENVNKEDIRFNIIDIFKSIYKNKLTANISGHITTSGTIDDIKLDGKYSISNLSVAVDGKSLPDSNVDMIFNDNKVKLYAKIFSEKDEITELIGDFKVGKHPNINLNCKSNAKFNSIINIIDSIAKSFDYYDLDTLRATGGIDADFSIKSDLKKVDSSGYLKVNNASIFYKLYNIAVNNINADIDFANSFIDIKKVSLAVVGQPLTIEGKISHKADIDVIVTADKLQLKGLLLALGQVALIKENDIKNGILSMNVFINGKLNNIVPKLNLIVENVDIRNIPSSTSLLVPNFRLDFKTDGKKANGNVFIKNMKVLNPMANILIPDSKVSFGEKDILINNAYLILDNSRIDIVGKISDYMSKNLNFDITAKGALLANDLKMSIPAEFRKDIKAVGKLPLVVKMNGNMNSQDISFKLNANNSNYVSLLTVDQLKSKNTDIKGLVKLHGDTLKFHNAGIFVNDNCLLALSGSINDLFKNQNLNLNIEVPNNVSFVIPGFAKSKINANGKIDVTGKLVNPILKGNVNVKSVNIPELTVNLQDMILNLNGHILKGKASLKKFVSGGIVAENLNSDFNLLNNVFYLKNLEGSAFSGKVNGNISYNILNGNIGIDFKGTGMNANDAIYGAANLKNALSGILSFTANLTLHGASEAELMRNLKGKVSFKISDGTLGNIGRFEDFLFAPNLQSNRIIRAAINSVVALPVIKNTAIFKTITGDLKFNNGWAYLNPVKTSGPSMAYYIRGQYNLLNSTANVVILGRISSEVVNLLGPLGELSVSKLTSYIPKFGTATGNIINALTSNPRNENVSQIPQLSVSGKNFKDFKVVFNGGVESRSSVKSFKWLSKCDMSGIQKVTPKEQVQQTKQAVQNVVQEKRNAYREHIEQQRQQANDARQQMKDATEGLKNLKNMFKSKPTPVEANTLQNAS